MRPRLAQIHQSGATDGQVPVWNDTTGVWEPGAGAGGGGSSGGVDLDSTKVSEQAPDDAAVWLPANMGDVTFSASAGDRVEVLSATEAWEDSSIQEVTVWFEDGLFHAIYTGGWSTTYLGYATAEHPLGPWTKHPGNPIFGNGLGGESTQVCRGSVFIDDDGQHYTYYAAPYSGGTIDLMVATGVAPNLTKVGVALTHTATATAIQNVCVVNDGGTYRMIFDSKASTGAFWQTGYATASSPLGPFTVNTFPVTSLQVAAGGIYGGPCLRRDAAGTGWVLLYHATAASGTLPNDIYRATSSNLTTWSIEAGPLVARTVDPPEHDQVADPWYLVTDFGGFLFWEGVDNVAETSAVMATRALGYGAPRWFDGDTWQTEWPGEVTQAELDAEEAARIAADAALAASIAALPTTRGELLMQDGVTAPPVPLENEAQDDWLYEG